MFNRWTEVRGATRDREGVRADDMKCSNSAHKARVLPHGAGLRTGGRASFAALGHAVGSGNAVGDAS
eukprot:SAG11_NODE_1931_length_4044_cov_1.223517_1_plen_67_part_00